MKTISALALDTMNRAQKADFGRMMFKHIAIPSWMMDNIVEVR